MSIGALYRGHFRSIIEPAGYQTEDSAQREWGITGVFLQLPFSCRQDILDPSATTPRQSRKAWPRSISRQAKHFEDSETLHEHWQTVPKDTGSDADVRGRTEQSAASSVKLKRRRREKVATPSVLDGAVREAIDRLSSKSVRVTYDDVMTSVLNHVPASEGSYGQARKAIDNAIGRGQLIAVDKNQTLFTTAAHVRDEARLAQLAAGLAESAQAGTGAGG
ncbi:hypothetical protein O3W44_21695 [Pantoea sp. LMR881]|uniref:hypothetical protein n=1 Tax=Pantoea sp. LMR881 TaxID=3014336 RepID=UPI0022AFCBA6|nr:hypothetical protein [Pantoea sp. LMR881]MCZ4061149.1 hypothetical protein [Pantoea sp. LMR881]